MAFRDESPFEQNLIFGNTRKMGLTARLYLIVPRWRQQPLDEARRAVVGDGYVA
jgi:hypothetical protein